MIGCFPSFKSGIGHGCGILYFYCVLAVRAISRLLTVLLSSFVQFWRIWWYIVECEHVFWQLNDFEQLVWFQMGTSVHKKPLFSVFVVLDVNISLCSLHRKNCYLDKMYGNMQPLRPKLICLYLLVQHLFFIFLHGKCHCNASLMKK